MEVLVFVAVGIVALMWVLVKLLFRLVKLLFPFMRKKCGICGKRSMTADIDNKDAYNACVEADGGCLKTHREVCSSCLEKRLNNLVCDKCHKTIVCSGVSVGQVPRELADAKRAMDAMKRVSAQLGKANSKEKKLLCVSCSEKVKRETIVDFLAALSRKGEAAQPILLHLASTHDSSHCARCGSTVPEGNNFALQLKCVYGDDAYPYSDLKDECCSVVNDYLHAEAICSSCCWQLRPEHVRADYLFRSGDGWIGGVKGSEVPGYCVTHRFDTVAYSKEDCQSIDAIKDKLRKKALLAGANGFIEFWYDIRSGRYYTGHAVPVTFERADKVESHDGKAVPQSPNDDSACPQQQTAIIMPDKIIIDGSNLIREKGGSSVNGLSACIEALKHKGCQVQVLLDANILYVLREDGDVEGADRLGDLLVHNSACVKMVPAGSRADDFILLRANEDCSHIVSNDRFNQYVGRYPWLKEGRLHKFMFMDGRLMIPDLGIDVEQRKD